MAEFRTGQVAGCTKVNVNTWMGQVKFNRFHTMLLALSICIISFDGYALSIYGPAVPLLLKDLHMSAAIAGAIGGYSFLGASVGALACGALASRIGQRNNTLLCLGVLCISMGLTALCHTAATFGFCRFLTGIGIGGIMPSIATVASEYAPLRHRTAIVAATFSGVQIGGLAAAALSMMLFGRFGWRSVFFLGALPVLLIPVFLKTLPESPAYLLSRNRTDELAAVLRRVRPDEPLPQGVVFEIQKGAGKAPVTAIFRDRRALSTLLICLVFFMNMYLNYGLIIWLPKLMMNAGFSLQASLSTLLALQFMAFFGIIGIGAISERLGNRLVMVTCFVIGALATALLGYTANLGWVVLLAALAGTCAASAQGVANGYGALYYPPAMRSTGIGFAYSSGRFGSMVSLTLTGVLVSAHISLGTTFVALAVPGLVAAAAVMLVQERHGFVAQTSASQLESVHAVVMPAISTSAQ